MDERLSDSTSGLLFGLDGVDDSCRVRELEFNAGP